LKRIINNISEYTIVKFLREFASFIYSSGNPEIVRDMQIGSDLVRSVFGKSDVGERKTLSALHKYCRNLADPVYQKILLKHLQVSMFHVPVNDY